MISRKKILTGTISTIIWLGIGVFVFCYHPMTTVFHEPTMFRVILATCLSICIILNIVSVWIKPKSPFTSYLWNDGLGSLVLILVLAYS